MIEKNFECIKENHFDMNEIDYGLFYFQKRLNGRICYHMFPELNLPILYDDKLMTIKSDIPQQQGDKLLIKENRKYFIQEIIDKLPMDYEGMKFLWTRQSQTN